MTASVPRQPGLDGSRPHGNVRSLDCLSCGALIRITHKVAKFPAIVPTAKTAGTQNTSPSFPTSELAGRERSDALLKMVDTQEARSQAPRLKLRTESSNCHTPDFKSYVRR